MGDKGIPLIHACVDASMDACATPNKGRNRMCGTLTTEAKGQRENVRLRTYMYTWGLRVGTLCTRLVGRGGGYDRVLRMDGCMDLCHNRVYVGPCCVVLRLDRHCMVVCVSIHMWICGYVYVARLAVPST